MVSDRRNFWLHVAEGAFCSFGMMAVGGQLVIPALILRLGGTPRIIGLMASLYGFGALVQFLTVRVLERLPRKKNVVLLLGFFMRIPYIAIAVAVLKWGADGGHQTAVLWIIVGSLLVSTMSMSLLYPAWTDMLGDTLPSGWYGYYFGSRGFITNVAGCAAGFAIYRVIERVAFPLNYGSILLFAFVMVAISWVFYCFVNDTPDEAVAAKESRREPFIEYVKSVPRLVRDDTAFRRYVIYSAIVFTARAASTFRGNAALERFDLEKELGTFMVLYFASLAVGSLLFPSVAARLGHRRNLLISCVLMVAADLIAALARSPTIYLGTFVFWGLAFGASQVSWMSYVLEQAPARTRMRYVSALSLLRVPVRVAAPLLLGLAIHYHGYAVAFQAGAVLHVVAALTALSLPRSGGSVRGKTDEGA